MGKLTSFDEHDIMGEEVGCSTAARVVLYGITFHDIDGKLHIIYSGTVSKNVA